MPVIKDLHVEWLEERARIRTLFNSWPMSKVTKESLLSRLRELEKNLGINPIEYNSPEFHRWVKGT